MNTTTWRPAALSQRSSDAPAAARSIMRLLQRLQHGQLTVQWPGGSVQTYGPQGAAPHAVLHLHDWGVCRAALQSGDIGFAEAYIAGGWSTPELTTLLQVLVANRRVLDAAIHGHWAGRLVYRLRHLLRRNTRANSRRNIHAHYDLGNAFYALWLDPTMNYSAAWFEGEPQRPLARAQQAKVRRALSMARVQPGQRLLEIGCGWGALAELATAECGAQVTGVTLSTEQLAYARQRLDAAGQSARAELRLQDYRDIRDQPFDAICSIEMVEAVGQAYWPTYFRTVARLLKPGGRACIQSIVIADGLFERYLRSTDFIQQYIFPGGCLPSPTALREQARAAGLRVEDELAFGPDYARTCRLWREAFLARSAEVLAQGYDPRFMRTWEFYLAYCEAGFLQGDLDVMQFTLVKA